MDDGTLIIWNLEMEQAAQTLHDDSSTITRMSWSENNKLASLSENGNINIWNIETGQSYLTLDANAYRMNWLSNDRLASYSQDGTVNIWDSITGMLQSSFPIPSGSTTGLDLDINAGGQLAIGDINGFITIWDINTGQEIQKLRGSPDQIFNIAWSPDGRLAIASREGQVWLLPAYLTHSPCQWLLRNLTKEEWQYYVTGLSIYKPTCPNLAEQ